jgi:Bacterial proteasome activator
VTSGAKAGQSGRQPAGLTTVMVPSRPAVVLGGPAGSPSACRVEEPDRLFRVWGMLNAASDELHKVELQPGAVPRLQRQLKAAIAELQRSVSPALAGELDRLTRPDDTAPATTGELRIVYAALLGWTGGLVIAVLDQLQQGNLDTSAHADAASQVTMAIPAGVVTVRQ